MNNLQPYFVFNLVSLSFLNFDILVLFRIGFINGFQKIENFRKLPLNDP